jgi:hypothetical protein
LPATASTSPRAITSIVSISSARVEWRDPVMICAAIARRRPIIGE